MTRHFSILILLLQMLLSAPAGAEEQETMNFAPGEAPVVQLYTMDQGDSVFERWGHAAICLHLAENPERDRCFNYGAAEFTTPLPLTVNVLRGEAEFWVSTTSPEEMLALYYSLDRTVWRQDLPLTDEQALMVANGLIRDASPASGNYRYHHIHDNCSTRLRDAIDEATGGLLSDDSDGGIGLTFRELNRQGLAEHTVMLLAGDLVLGRTLDVEVNKWEAMFLPDYLRLEVRGRLGVEPLVVLERQGPSFPQDVDGGERLWFAIVALLSLLPIIASWITKRWGRLTAGLTGVIPGLLGLFLWTLALITTLPEIRWNEVLLCFLPFDLALLVLGVRFQVWYARIRAAQIVVVVVLVLVGVLIQPILSSLLMAGLPMFAVAFWHPATAARKASIDGVSPGV